MLQDELSTQFVGAMKRGDFDVADAMLARMSTVPIADAALAGELHLFRRRWCEAAALLSRVLSKDAGLTLKLHLARNLDSLQRHRPELYERMIGLQRSDRYRFTAVLGGKLSIADCIDPAHPCILTPNQNPQASVADAMAQLDVSIRQCAPMALNGIGDGFLFAILAQQNVKRMFDRQQVVFLLEPDEQLLFTCLMLHDYSGVHGPIEQGRFQWCVGHDWEQQFENRLTEDMMLLPPTTFVGQSCDTESIAQGTREVSERYAKNTSVWREAANEIYESVDASEWAMRFRGEAERPPRVLLLTTRFSTVLQYATRDVAEGFRQNGWESLVLKETQPWQMISDMALRKTLLEYQPDLVFQIDHLRHEHLDAVPDGLPFACWIQDHLTHLTSTKAGRGVGDRDYVLTFASPLFVDTYEYPVRQCIDMPMMLTRGSTAEHADSHSKAKAKASSTQRSSKADDIVYVSNVSQVPEQAFAQVLRTLPPSLHEIARAASARVISTYESDGSLKGHQSVRELLNEVCSDEGRRLSLEEHTSVVDQLWNPLNIALYRQQALGWVADAASDLGLSLGIYGRGWEQHPRFSSNARGVIEHGDPLAHLTRSTPINLILEPYVCFTHHRMLDGLSSGGFFLVREHPGNTALQALLNLLDEHKSKAENVEQARADLAGVNEAKLEALLAAAACSVIEPTGDPVRQIRCMCRAGVLIRQDEALPRLPEVSFNNAESCRQRIERFVADDDARTSIAEDQRRSIDQRFTFKVGVRHVIDSIVERLTDEQANEKTTENDNIVATSAA